MVLKGLVFPNEIKCLEKEGLNIGGIGAGQKVDAQVGANVQIWKDVRYIGYPPFN